MHHLLSMTLAVAALFAPSFIFAPPAGAQDKSPSSWAETKCALYKDAWAYTLKSRDMKGVGREFIDRHNAFLASGCTMKANVCPRSPEELELASFLTILSMNEGMASTFVPFACRD